MGGRITSKTSAGHALCFTVREFCDLHRLSLGVYYRLRKAGLGPTEIRIGAKKLITKESAERWRQQQDAAAKL